MIRTHQANRDQKHIIWLNPPKYINVKTNVGMVLMRMIDTFPASYHKYN